jgi:hypothetical protein
MLENGVSKYPSMDGRYIGVSGLKFKFNATEPIYNRIKKEDIFIN